MVVLGLILVLVAVVAGVVVVYENSGSDHTISISAFGGEWQADAFWMAVIGAAILVVAVLGIGLIRGGSRRGLRRRQERKELKRENAALADRVRHTEPAAQHEAPEDEARRSDAPPSYDPMTTSSPSYVNAPPAYEEEPPRRTP